ncbi:MAG: hypothetical protein IT288_16650 [Bdellovibrionales bacterium]|nr:hypothetical protein [Bdellovibrionales bacterium]
MKLQSGHSSLSCTHSIYLITLLLLLGCGKGFSVTSSPAQGSLGQGSQNPPPPPAGEPPAGPPGGEPPAGGPGPETEPPPINTQLCERTESDSPLKKVAQNMKAGDWREVDTIVPTGIQYYRYNGFDYPVTHAESFFREPTWGAHNVYADSMAWDPKARCIYFYGSGHLDIPVHLKFCEATNKWSLGKLHPDHEVAMEKERLEPDVGHVWGYTGHGWASNAFDSDRQIFYNTINGRDLMAFDVKSQAWVASLVNPFNNGAYYGTSNTYFEGLGMVQLSKYDGTGAIFLNSTQKWEKFYDVGNGNADHYGVSEYNPKSDLMIFNLKSGPKMWSLDRQLQVKEIATAPTDIGANNGGYDYGGNLVDDPASGNFVFRRQSPVGTSGKMFEYVVKTNSWRSLPDSPMTGYSTTSVSIPDYDVIVFLQGDERKVWLYKNSGVACP